MCGMCGPAKLILCNWCHQHLAGEVEAPGRRLLLWQDGLLISDCDLYNEGPMYAITHTLLSPRPHNDSAL